MEKPDCESLLRYFDELNECHNRVSTADFKNHLLRWGVPKDVVKKYIAQFDPKKTGYIRRRDMCNALDYHPSPPSYLKEVEIIQTDMSEPQRESIIKIVLDEVRRGGQPKTVLYGAKNRIEKLYGKGWNLFQAYGGYWGWCQYKDSTNLWFKHKGTTYGVFQVPSSKNSKKSSRH